MIHSASPQSRPKVIVAWFEVLGRTDRRTLCVKKLITTGRDCDRPRGSNIDCYSSRPSGSIYNHIRETWGPFLAAKTKCEKSKCLKWHVSSWQISYFKGLSGFVQNRRISNFKEGTFQEVLHRRTYVFLKGCISC